MSNNTPKPPATEGIAYALGWHAYYITRGEFKFNPCTGPIGSERWEQGWADARELEYEERCR